MKKHIGWIFFGAVLAMSSNLMAAGDSLDQAARSQLITRNETAELKQEAVNALTNEQMQFFKSSVKNLDGRLF